MSKEILQEGDFQYTMFIHLYEEYQSIVNAVGAGEKEYERLQKADVMYKAWDSCVPKESAYESKRYLQNINVKYAQLHYWKQMLNTFLTPRYSEHREAPHECPSVPKYPAGYEQAFQAIVLQAAKVGTDLEREKKIMDLIDWSKFCHLHEELRKTWSIELSMTHYTNYSGKVDKLSTRKLKDNPQA